MFKINFKTLSTTALAATLLAGALATPAFAKGGYENKYTVNSNRSVYGVSFDRVRLEKRIAMPKLGKNIIW